MHIAGVELALTLANVEDCAANLRLPGLKARGFWFGFHSHHPAVEPGGRSARLLSQRAPTVEARDRGERETASPSARSSSGFRLTPSSGRLSPRGAKPEKSKACLRVAWFPTFPSYSSWLVQVYQRHRHMSSGLAWEGDFPTHAPNKGTIFLPLVETQGFSNPGFCNNSFSHSNP